MVRKDRMMTPNAPVAPPTTEGEANAGDDAASMATDATEATTTAAPAKRPVVRKKVERQPQLNVNERPRRQIKHKYIRNLLYTGGPSNRNGNIESPSVFEPEADAESGEAEAPEAATGRKPSLTSGEKTTTADNNDAAGLNNLTATVQQQLATLKRKRGRPKKVPAIVAAPAAVVTEALSPSPPAQCPASSSSPQHSESSDAIVQLLDVIDDDDSASVELIEIVPSPAAEEDLEVANATITVDSEQFELLVVEDDSQSPVQQDDLNGICVQQESDDCFVVTVGTDSPTRAPDTNGDNQYVVELGESEDVVCVVDESRDDQAVNVYTKAHDDVDGDKSSSPECDSADNTLNSTLNSSCNSNGSTDMHSDDRHPFNMRVVRRIVANLDQIASSTSRPRSPPKLSKAAKANKNRPLNIASEIRRVTRRNSILFAPGPANQSKALAKLLGTSKASDKSRNKVNSLARPLSNECDAQITNGQTTTVEALLPVSQAAIRTESIKDVDPTTNVFIGASNPESIDLTGDESQTDSSVASMELQSITSDTASRMPVSPTPSVLSIELTPTIMPALNEETPDNLTDRSISSSAPITADETRDGELSLQPAVNCSDKKAEDAADVVEVLKKVSIESVTPQSLFENTDTMPTAPKAPIEETIRVARRAASTSSSEISSDKYDPNEFRLPKTIPERSASHKLTSQTNGTPSPKCNATLATDAMHNKRTEHRRESVSVRSKSSSRTMSKNKSVEVKADHHTPTTDDAKRSRESTPHTNRYSSEKKITVKADVIDTSKVVDETLNSQKLTGIAASTSSAETIPARPIEIRSPKPVQEKTQMHKPAARLNGIVSPKTVIQIASNKRTDQRRESVSAPSKTVSRAPPKKTIVEEKFDPYAILSKCYMPKQVKHDASLYSIEAQRAARAKEAEAKAEAEAVRRDAVSASAAADSKPNYSWMSNGVAKIPMAPPSFAPEIVSKAELKSEIETAVVECKTEPLSVKDDVQPDATATDPTTDVKPFKVEIDDNRLTESANDTMKPAVHQPCVETTSLTPTPTPEASATSKTAPPEAPSGENNKSPKDVDEDTSNTRRRSGRIKIISETKQQSRGTGLVRNRDRLHNKMSAIDVDASSEGASRVSATASPQSFTSDGQPYNSHTHSASSPCETYSPRSEYLRSISPASLQRHQRDVREGLGLFKQIVDNEFRSERNISKEAKRMTCDCFLTAAEVARGEYGCGEDCLNRLLMIECGSKCVVAERCTNKRFQRHQTSECTIFKTEKKGFGLRALCNITAGDFIMEYVGEVLNAEQFEQRAAEYAQEKNRHHYFMALRSDCVIDATLRGNISRFINHSCDPNAETQKWTVNGELRIGFFCAKDIAAGDEITFDYQFQRYGKAAQRCYCEAECCRGWIGEEPESDDEVEEDDEDDHEAADESIALKSPISADLDVEMTKLSTSAMAASSADAAAQIAATAASQLDALVSSPTTTTASASKSGKTVGRKPSAAASARLLKPKRLAKTPKRAEIMEDPDLDMHIDILTRSQLKNQAQTLRFSRLMVRAKLRSAKSQLLCILRSGELACRRLFLDYHGLKLLHAWMSEEAKDSSGADSSCGWDFRLEILQTLAVLPIPNKLLLDDSKVLHTVREWSKISLQPEKPKDSPAAGAAATAAAIDIPKLLLDENTDLFQGIGLDALKQIITTNEENAKRLSEASNREQSTEVKSLPETKTAAETPTEAPIDKHLCEIVPLAKTLVNDWKQLPEVFRIPKRQRIEQMKEHEREANRNYRALGYTDDKDEVLANRRNMERFRERERDQQPQPIAVQQQQQQPTQRYIRPIDRYPPAAGPSSAFASSGSSESSASLKMHRRQQFEAKVAAEQLAAEQQQIHEMKCNFFHLNASRTDESMVPFAVNPYTSQWYGVYGQPVATPPSHVHIKPPVPKHTTDLADFDLPPVELPDHWKCAVDAHGRIYYYHAKIRIPQWVPPIKLQPLAEVGGQQPQPEVGSAAAATSAMMLAGVGDESSSDEDDGNGSDEELLLKIQEVEQLIAEQRKPFDVMMPMTADHSQTDADCLYDPIALQEAAELTMSTILPHKQRKKRPLLVEERSISPCTEEDRQLLRAEMRRYRENKDKMRHRRRRNRTKVAATASAASRTINLANDEDDDDEDDDLDSSNAEEDRRDGVDGSGEAVDLEDVDATTFAGTSAVAENDGDAEKTRNLKRPRDREDSEESDDEPPPIVSEDPSDEVARTVTDARIATKRAASTRDTEERGQMDRSLTKRKKHTTDASQSPPEEPQQSQPPPSHPSSSSAALPPSSAQPESSEMAGRRIKDKFRANIAGVIVHNLTPYRRPDCPVGQISTDDDFRHLAKKLTHFVMLKELKHCANTVHALEVTDSVRSKAKEFVRKYMTKFGPVYRRGDNEPEYKTVAGVLP